MYEEELNQQKEVLKEILSESYKKKVQYSEYLTFCSQLTSSIVEKEIATTTLIKNIQDEESSLKTKRSRKGNLDEEEKLSDIIMKERKTYLLGLVAKLTKEQEKYGSISVNEFRPKMEIVCEKKIV